VITLGRFEVLIDDKPVQTTRFRKKLLLFLKALVALGGNEVREDILSEYIWPDAEGDLAYNALRTTLSRLRRFLGNDESVILHEGAVTLNPKYVWVDTWAFLNTCGTADKKKGSASEMAARILELYQGNFLPMEDEHWMVSYRERLRERFLRVIISLCRELEGQGRWDEAIACYRAAIDADDLAEEVYQRLMLCYGNLGDNATALSVYERLHKVLKARLDIKPSTRTEMVHEHIKASIKT
jgi:DNA-binding SARP family transcriptional activator